MTDDSLVSGAAVEPCRLRRVEDDGRIVFQQHFFVLRKSLGDHVFADDGSQGTPAEQAHFGNGRTRCREGEGLSDGISLFF